MFNFLKPSLKLCVILDLIGMATFLVPGIGEGFDTAWAPISALIFFAMFKSPIGALLAGAEEIIPFTDIIPSFTIGYFLLHKMKKSQPTVEYTTYEEIDSTPKKIN